MTRLERLVARLRRSLLATERKGLRDIIGGYGDVSKRLRLDLDELLAQIDNARQAGETPNVSWLVRQERYTILLTQLESALTTFAAQSADVTERLQRQAAIAAADDATALIKLAAGTAPPGGTAAISITFGTPPASVIDRIVGNAADGTPLGDLLGEIAGRGVREVRTALQTGVAAGHSPRDIARAVQRASGSSLARALTIARTESIRAYRDITADQYKRSRSILEGWVWNAALDRRTCPACWAMHGQEFTVDETLDSHPNCRCAMIPKTKSWADLGFPGTPDSRPSTTGGPDLFSKLSGSDQAAILGPGKYQAYKDGQITLPDLVHRTDSPRWGPGRREATLREALT